MTAETLSPHSLAVGHVHEVDLPVRWGDLDAINHLNNTVYFRLMEEARMRILFGAGMKLPDETGAILAHASCDFVRAVNYPATVRVRHSVAALGRSSLTLDLTLCDAADPSVLYARGRNVLVWMDYRSNQSCPWPAQVLADLARVMHPAPAL
ncbi:thioesterase family protein [Orrella sp. JC864]|uniref:acyl-CoA thioesterase n=1 Tax=Orrella sp. JC864 TaxID=3120298 RepID=UPI0012BCD73E